jgi:hypothetical protein
MKARGVSQGVKNFATKKRKRHKKRKDRIFAARKAKIAKRIKIDSTEANEGNEVKILGERGSRRAVFAARKFAPTKTLR